ncbi:MAG TPA: NlpC/P60 family protein [Candidatus Dormibacteraeota bacterium]|nr:NlpC/P60 family protein [Candidatus Dormibacteraeota bacterium]
MRIRRKAVTLVLAFGLPCCVSWAQDQDPHAAKSLKTATTASSRGQKSGLSMNERRSVIAAALESKKSPGGGHDCSHLVHSIYQRAGFPYTYADSDDIYAGTEGFRRVSRPQPGDLVVWPGHVGIVIRPTRHAFYSFLSRGPGIDDYQSRYWRGRGVARFYRYVKWNGCAGCTVARGPSE